MVISYSLMHGRRAAIPLVVAVAGVGSVLAASAMAFTLVKTAGGIYLRLPPVRTAMSRVD
jgi:threonine/homoserine/homoserine lactone efflux protein